MPTTKDPPQDRLRAILSYDPDTGVFIWRERADCLPKWNGRWAGKQAGGLHKGTGYWRIAIDNMHYYAHRLAWIYVHGEIPDGRDIDHRDTIKTNNRINNLRPVTMSQNMANQRRHKNKTLPKGVCWDASAGRYLAQIVVRRRRIVLGHHDTVADALSAYAAAAQQHFGDFSRID